MSAYLDREPIPAPARPFTVVEHDGEIFIRRRDGKPLIPARILGEPECTYRHRCDWFCRALNEAFYDGAREEIKRAQDINAKSARAFLSGPNAMADLAVTMAAAAE